MLEDSSFGHHDVNISAADGDHQTIQTTTDTPLELIMDDVFRNNHQAIAIIDIIDIAKDVVESNRLTMESINEISKRMLVISTQMADKIKASHKWAVGHRCASIKQAMARMAASNDGLMDDSVTFNQGKVDAILKTIKLVVENSESSIETTMKDGVVKLISDFLKLSQLTSSQEADVDNDPAAADEAALGTSVTGGESFGLALNAIYESNMKVIAIIEAIEAKLEHIIDSSNQSMAEAIEEFGKRIVTSNKNMADDMKEWYICTHGTCVSATHSMNRKWH